MIIMIEQSTGHVQVIWHLACVWLIYDYNDRAIYWACAGNMAFSVYGSFMIIMIEQSTGHVQVI